MLKILKMGEATMNRLMLSFGLIAGLMMSSSANATKYAFTMTGKVSYIAHTEYVVGGSQPLNITSKLQLSDPVKVWGLFDTLDYPSFASNDTDPTFGYYFGGFQDITYKFGDYVYASEVGQESFGSVTISNDKQLDGVSERYDGWSITNLLDVTGQKMPVDLGPGRTLATFGLNAYDFTGNARKTSSIIEPVNLQSYASQSGSVSFYNTSLNRFSTYLLSDLNVSVSAVPETSTWILMLIGFAITGQSLRRRIAVSLLV
jgi:hypothetical protein